jgi:zinc protease
MPDRIRNREGLSYGAGSRLLRPIAGDGALFSASVTCNPANAPKVEASFLDELTKSVRDGFTQAELDASRKVLLESLRSGRTQDGALVAALQSRQEQGRTMQWDIAYEKRLSELTLQQLNAAWRKHMDPAALTIVKAGDFKKAGVWQ